MKCLLEWVPAALGTFSVGVLLYTIEFAFASHCLPASIWSKTAKNKKKTGIVLSLHITAYVNILPSLFLFLHVFSPQGRPKRMHLVWSSLMNWTVWVGRGSSLQCTRTPGRPSTNCLLRWMGMFVMSQHIHDWFSRFYIYYSPLYYTWHCFGCDCPVGHLNTHILLLSWDTVFLISLLPVTFFFFHRFKPNEGVIIIGATNFPEALDKYVCLHVLLQRLKWQRPIL